MLAICKNKFARQFPALIFSIVAVIVYYPLAVFSCNIAESAEGNSRMLAQRTTKQNVLVDAVILNSV
jgi:hypothetical protein